MTTRKVFHCIVDDTALITNISEIKNWISRGAITLVVPVYTLGRLHLLRKDASQIGMNAREAQKFLDRITSGEEGVAANAVTIQEPDEEYKEWAEAEAHFMANNPGEKEKAADTESTSRPVTVIAIQDKQEHSPQNAGGALSQMLLNKLNFVKNAETGSPNSTPPTSPTSSAPQSSKTSPEVKSANMTTHDASATPQMLKPLINSVVWYTYEKNSSVQNPDYLFLTNAAETANLARGFGIMPKNIHQLRTAIGMEEQEIKNHDKYSKKHLTPPPTAAADTEPKTLLSYEEDSEDDEVVVFKPRGRGMRGTASTRGTPTGSLRGKIGLNRSPTTSLSTPNGQVKPQIPVEEIDPDSFDRGGFARGSIPLAITGNHGHGNFQGFLRGPARGGFSSGGPSRGGFYRGAPRGGFDRGAGPSRGRGRLFVP